MCRKLKRFLWTFLIAGLAISTVAETKKAAIKLAVDLNSREGARTRKYAKLPKGIIRKHVTIWSDGTKIAADLYLPENLKPEDKLPIVVFANGTGGVKRKLPTRIAPSYVQAGYAFICFDYRGWGESDSKLMILDEMPDPDSDEIVTVKARAIRWQMDYADQTEDIQNVIAFVSGEPNIDPKRIGLFGTSFGGGLVTWVAAHDLRVKCLVAQVPGMGGKRHAAALRSHYELAKKQARGEAEPVPYKSNRPNSKKYGQVRYNRAKWSNFDPVRSSDRITAPTLIIDVGNDALMDISKNGKMVYDTLKKNGVAVKHHIIPDAPHYAVYGSNFKEVTDMQIKWFDTYLKVLK